MNSPTADTGPAEYPGQLPGVVLCTAGVAARVAPLAGQLCDAPVLPLDSSTEQIQQATADNPSALILITPSTVGCTDVAQRLASLTACGIHNGVLFAEQEHQARELCRKVLRREPLPRRGDAFVLTHVALDEDRDPLAPIVRSRLPHRPAPSDVIVFSGHSGPLDACAGSGAILCARADAAGYRGPGVFSCYHDGLCFRQPQLDRLADDPTELVPPSQVDVQVAVVAGCGSLTLGRGSFSPAFGLSQLLHEGPPLAVIATSGVTFKVLELDLICLSWITSGVPLGEVVRRLNSFSSRMLHEDGSMPPLTSPYVLLGNPGLRFEAPAEPDTRTLPADVELRPGASHVPLKLQQKERGTVTLDPGEETPLHAFFDAPRETLHLWKGAGHRLRVRLEAGPGDPYLHHRVPIQRAAREVPFWMALLKMHVMAAAEGQRSAEIFTDCLETLDSWTMWAGRAYRRLWPQPGVPVNHQACRAVIQRLVRPAMARWNSDLGGCLTHAAVDYRTFPMEWWSGWLFPEGDSFVQGPCPCGRAERRAQRFAHPAHAFKRVMYQCNNCGPVGDDDGSQWLWFDELSDPPAAGAPVELACTISAPADEQLYVHLVPVLDCRMARDSVAGEVQLLEVPAGESLRVETSITTPADLSPGIYPVSFFATINGVLVNDRRLMELLP